MCPFKCDWESLSSDWCNHKTDTNMEVEENCDSVNRSLYVLRSRRKLEVLKLFFEYFSQKKGASVSELIDLFPNYESERCLIPVVVTMLYKGNPSDRAMICIPTESDLNLKNHQGPFEPMHEDCNRESRKLLLREHKRHMNRERRKRKREAKLAEDSGETVTKKKKKSAPVIEPNSSNMIEINDLWLLKNDNIKNSCSREVFGFLSKGNFSFSESCGVGIGYVTLGGIIKLAKSATCAQPLVLIRNTTSLNYKFAKLQIGMHS